MGISDTKRFLWVPGEGVDTQALMRLRARFPRPSEPMGEAWFMGTERRMFPELLGNLDVLTAEQLLEPLGEIVSGTCSLGPLEEWHAWYHYLLGALLSRSHESFVSSLLESLMSGCMAIYPNGIQREPYQGFREDVLLTLGRSMMDAGCWHGKDIAPGKILRRSSDNPNKVWVWWNASGDLSASMFFCLKYLPELTVGPWLRSVFEIPSPHWRAQVIVWLVGAHDILHGAIGWPSDLSDQAYPAIGWEWSHCLRAESAAMDEGNAPLAAAFLSQAARHEALDAVKAYFDENRFLEWLACISTVPYLEAELGDIPSIFEHFYVR